MKIFVGIRTVAFCAALSVISAGGALAETPAASATANTIKSLLTQGFEVKDVLYLSGSATTREAQQVEKNTVLITLQKGALTAACWFDLSLWISQQISTGTCNVLQ